MSKILSSLVQRSRFVNWSLIQSQTQILSRPFSKGKGKGDETRDFRKRRTLKSLQDKLSDIAKGKSPLRETSDSKTPHTTVYTPRAGSASEEVKIEGDKIAQNVESEDHVEILPPKSTVPHDMFKVKIEGPQVIPSEYAASKKVLSDDERINQTKASQTPQAPQAPKANKDTKSSTKANMDSKQAVKTEITPVGGTKNFFRVTNVVQKPSTPPATPSPRRTGKPTTQPKADLQPNLKTVQDEAAKKTPSDAKTTPSAEAKTTYPEAKTTTVDSITTTPKSDANTPKK